MRPHPARPAPAAPALADLMSAAGATGPVRSALGRSAMRWAVTSGEHLPSANANSPLGQRESKEGERLREGETGAPHKKPQSVQLGPGAALTEALATVRDSLLPPQASLSVCQEAPPC